MSTDADIGFMRRAIALAWTRFGDTRPNPAVGCVLVRDGAVLAEGVTQAGGRPHAEEQALAALAGETRGVDVFVTLEPCGARSGGGPSCSERLIAAGVARVVIAWEDRSPYAAGQGAERLRAAGTPVEIGLLADEAEPLYAGYAHRLRTGRPLVVTAADGEGSEAQFTPRPGEGIEAALLRYGAEGYSRLWIGTADPLVEALVQGGFLDRPR